MDEKAGLRLALDLLSAPSRIGHARSCELPDGVELVLRIAGQETAAIEEAAKFFDHPRDFVERAAVFFIEQVLLTPGTDSYRVLGARRDASNTELRRNFLLLLKCLHPDQARGGELSALLSRVIESWNQLKTIHRRASYDAEHRAIRYLTQGEGKRARVSKGNRNRVQLKANLYLKPKGFSLFSLLSGGTRGRKMVKES
jgi:DnaJ-class molecular chaperone